MRRLVKGDVSDRFRATDQDGVAVVKGSQIINASKGTVGAWLLNFTSNERQQIHVRDSGNLPRATTHIAGTRTYTSSGEIKIPFLSNRQFDSAMVWDLPQPGDAALELLDGYNDALVIAFEPPSVNDQALTAQLGVLGSLAGDIEEPKKSMFSRALALFKPKSTKLAPNALGDAVEPWPSAGAASTAVLGMTRGLYLIKPLAPYVSQITIYQSFDLKGKVPKAASYYISSYLLTTLDTIADKYQRPRKVINYGRQRIQPNASMEEGRGLERSQ